MEKAENVLWELFKNTGNISYYLLMSKLGEKGEQEGKGHRN